MVNWNRLHSEEQLLNQRFAAAFSQSCFLCPSCGVMNSGWRDITLLLPGAAITGVIAVWQQVVVPFLCCFWLHLAQWIDLEEKYWVPSIASDKFPLYERNGSSNPLSLRLWKTWENTGKKWDGRIGSDKFLIWLSLGIFVTPNKDFALFLPCFCCIAFWNARKEGLWVANIENAPSAASSMV